MVSQPLLRQAYDAYSFAIIPRMGGLVAGDADSYQYLVESIRQFPDQVSPVDRGREWCPAAIIASGFTCCKEGTFVSSNLNIPTTKRQCISVFQPV